MEQTDPTPAVSLIDRTPVNWDIELCDCPNGCETFCMAWWCPAVTYKDIRQIFLGRDTPDYQHYCFLNCMSACAGAAYAAGSRGEIREKYGIDGTFENDFLIHWCCTPCALNQEYYQVTHAIRDEPTPESTSATADVN